MNSNSNNIGYQQHIRFIDDKYKDIFNIYIYDCL